MSEKRKTDIIKILICAAIAMAAVLLPWIFSQVRFRNIPIVLVFSFAAAFLIETAVLLFLKGKNIIKRMIKIFLLFAVNISVFFSAVVYSFAPAVILQPHSDEDAHNGLSQTAAEEITFNGTEGEISGWFYEAAGKDAPTVLYFYGNYETAATRLNNLIKNYEVSAFSECNFAVFDYPSYGRSEGRCTDETMLQFSLDVYDELIKRTDRIIVLGYSVGTGPALYLASERECEALILYAPYSNGADLYNNIIDIFHGPLEKLVAFDIRSEEYAAEVNEPALILASEKDELIPYLSSMNLIDKFGGSCTFMKTSGITHNQFLTSEFVKAETEKFIEEVMKE